MSMYKIKLIKQFVADITVTNGRQVVVEVPASDYEIILGNRGEIISCAIDIETMIDGIISNLLFDQRSDSKLFKEFFLSQDGVTLHTKERALSRLLEAKRIYERDDDRIQLIRKIANIKETRNRFAHGKIYQPPDGAYLEYYKKGLKPQKLDDEYWKKVEKDFNTMFQLLSELSNKVAHLRAVGEIS